MVRTVLLGSLFACSLSCALLTKADPVVPRYFTPERAEVVPSARGTGAGLSVRIGHVGGDSYLRERMAYRDSDHEFGFYEDRRWTERPEVYVQRALEGAFFEERGVKRALALTAPTLTVDLIEFEEVKGPSPRVRLRLSYALHDERTVFLEHTFAIERPLPPGPDATEAERVAAGLGDALRDAVTRVVDDVVASLSAPAAH